MSRVANKTSASRDRILDATFAVIAERGYGGTTLAAVTKQSGLPASSVYWHFANKDELIAEVLDRTYARWRETGPTWSPPLRSDHTREDFEALSAQAAEGIFGKPEFWSLGLVLSLQQNVSEPKALERFLEIRRRARAMVAHWWREALPGTALDADPALPERLARLLMVLGDGFYIESRADSQLTAAEINREISAVIMAALHASGSIPE